MNALLAKTAYYSIEIDVAFAWLESGNLTEKFLRKTNKDCKIV